MAPAFLASSFDQLISLPLNLGASAISIFFSAQVPITISGVSFKLSVFLAPPLVLMIMSLQELLPIT